MRIPSINQAVGAVQSSVAEGPLAGKRGVILFQPVPAVPPVGQKPAEEREPSSTVRRSTLSGADTVEFSRSGMARLADATKAEQKRTKLNPDEVNPDEVKPDEVNPDEVKPDEVKPDEVKPGEGGSDEAKPGEGDSDEGEPDGAKSADGEALDTQEKAQLTEMQNRDREVRAHEQAHQAAAGSLSSGGPSYSYEDGPDGRKYAVGGEVQISLKDGSTPDETIRLAQQARAAALAPAQPSGQDQSVASKASQRENAARAQAYSSTSEEQGEGPSLREIFA